MQSAYKRKAYGGYKKKTYKRPAYTKSKFSNARPVYTKGVVKATQELKQWGFIASVIAANTNVHNLAGVPLVNAPAANNGVFAQNANESALCLCHAIGQGSGANQRIGSKIMANRLDFTVDVLYNYTANNVFVDARCFQYAVIVDTQWSGSAIFSPSECFYNPDGTGRSMNVFYNNSSRFKILKRGIVNPTITTPMASTADNVALLPRYSFSKSINLRKMEVKYRAATAQQNTPADVQSNQIILIFYDNETPTILDFYVTGTLSYYDA